MSSLLKLVTEPLAILRWQFIVLDSTPVSLSRYEGIRTLAKLFFCFRTIRKSARFMLS
jgi:hypothetical protein